MNPWNIHRASLLTLILFMTSCSDKEVAKTTTNSTMKKSAKALEKDELTLGFIKLTDMAPLAIAKELGYFEDEGLYVTLQAQANWKVLLDRVIGGELDGAHMLAGQPLAATAGFGTKAELVTPFVMDLHGNAITVSNGVWKEMLGQLPKDASGKTVHPIPASALKTSITATKTKRKLFTMGVVFPVSTHNYELRYWLAASGIHPGFYTPSDNSGTTDAEVILSVTPPPQMPSTLEAGTIQGYCVGEPWNQQAVAKGIGAPVITSSEIFQGRIEKVFGVTKIWATQNPNTLKALTKALIRANAWLDSANGANRTKAVQILAKPEYVGADSAVIANSMTGHFEFAKGDVRPAPDFNVFFNNYASYPYYSDAVWFLTQMRRWGQLDVKSNAWYDSTARQVFLPEVWRSAAEELVQEGKLASKDIPTTDGYKPATKSFIDQIEFNAKNPTDYLKSLKIGKQ